MNSIGTPAIAGLCAGSGAPMAGDATATAKSTLKASTGKRRGSVRRAKKKKARSRGSEQSDHLSVFGQIDFFCGRYLGQTGHRQYVAADHDDEFRPGRQAHFANIDHVP